MPDLSYKTRRKLSAVLLLVWLPIYVYIAAWVLGALPRMHILIELVIYVLAAFLWVVPFKFVFKGVGKPDPNATPTKFLDDDFIAAEKEIRKRQ